MTAAVIGAGAWGTALACVLAGNGHKTYLWCRRAQRAEELVKTRCNPRLPGCILPENVIPTADPACVQDCDLVVIASPSSFIRSVCRAVAPFLKQGTVLVSVTKGIEQDTLLRMSQVVEQECGGTVVALSGPCHAEEVAQNLPTGCVAACEDQALAEFVQDAFMSESFRVYTSPDIVGAELGGALKNVIALCAGVLDGMNLGDNTRAMLMTRGLTEIARLGVSLGAHKETLAGLSGIGDLIVTCTSMHSRNHRAGILIGQGKTPQEAMEEVGAVVEGYYAAGSAYALGQKQHIDMPIVRAAHQVLYQGADVHHVIQELMNRRRKAEPEDAGWN